MFCSIKLEATKLAPSAMHQLQDIPPGRSMQMMPVGSAASVLFGRSPCGVPALFQLSNLDPREPILERQGVFGQRCLDGNFEHGIHLLSQQRTYSPTCYGRDVPGAACQAIIQIGGRSSRPRICMD